MSNTMENKDLRTAEAAITAEAEPYVIQVSKTERRKVPVWAKVSMITVSVLVVAYFAGVIYFSMHFSWNTTLNGLDVSLMDAKQAQTALETMIQDYQLEIRTRGGKAEVISGKDIDLDFQLIGTVKQTIQQQNAWLWFLNGWNPENNTIEAKVTYDADKLHQQIRALNCMQRENIIEPVEPQIVKNGNAYIVQEGDAGQKPIALNVRKTIEIGISNLIAYVDLEESDCYAVLEYDSEDTAITEALEFLNALEEMKITYQFNEKEENLDGKEILNWVEISEDYEISIDKSEMEAYIGYLKDTYELRGQVINFHTSYGETVEITSYIRSNELNTEVESEHLMEAIQNAMESGKTEFVRDSEDMASVGDTYIEINLTSQYLYCYKDGKVILETDIVSGKPSTGCATPPGIYSIRAKSSPAILVGATYRQPVSYWMPFNGGIGLHDATWQSAFGGQWYLPYGSHGCINLPLDAAKFIYENYGAGDTVVLYHLEGTERAEATPAARPVSSPIYVHVPPEEPEETPTTETPTETPTEVTTETPTEISTETSTETPTEVMTETSTEIPTEASTEAMAETPAQALAE